MKGFASLTKKETDDILKQHSKTYDGYAVGNVSSNMYPISVYDDARDSAGITLTNKNVPKTYTNHRINEITAKPLNYDDIDNAYDFQSGGPQQSMVMNVYDEKPAYHFKSKGPVDVYEEEEDDDDDDELSEQDDAPNLQGTSGYSTAGDVEFAGEDDNVDISVKESINKTIEMFERFNKFN